MATDMYTLKGHRDWVNSAAFSHDSALVVSASDDHTVKIWDAKTATCVYTLEGHRNMVNSAAFSHDSTLVVSASIDRTVKIWDSKTAMCIKTVNLGLALSPFSCHYTSSLFLTDFGFTALDPSFMPEISLLVTPQTCLQDYRISQNGTWITRGSEGVLWLPPEYRPSCSAVAGSTCRNRLWLGIVSGSYGCRKSQLEIGQVLLRNLSSALMSFINVDKKEDGHAGPKKTKSRKLFLVFP